MTAHTAQTQEVGKVVGNIVALGGSEVAARLVAFGGTAYLARVLGPEGFGVVAFALALCGFLSLGVTAGFGDVGTREVARRPEEASELAAGATLVRLGLATAGFVVIGGLAWVLDKPPPVQLVLLLTGLTLFSLALDTTWVFYGLERNRRVGVALILRQLSYVGLVLLLVRGTAELVLVPLAQFLAEVAAALWLGTSLFFRRGARVDVGKGLAILKSSGYVTFSRLFRTCIMTLDVVLLGIFLGEREVGLYTAPYRFCFLLLAFATAIHVSYLPAFSRAATQGTEPLRSVFRRSVELSSAVAVPLVVGGIILAVPLLRLLFGAAYLGGAPAFQLLILSIGLIFLSAAIHNVLLVRDGLRIELWIVATAALLNVGLNILLIPAYGLLGAASATVAAEAIILLLGLLAIRRLGITFSPWAVARPLAAALGMAGTLLAVGPERGLAVCLPVGLLAYVSLLALFRGIPQDALPSWLSLLPQQVRRVWHFRVGPSAARLAGARTRLSGRKYYKLYDDMYREIQQHGGSQERESEIARTRQLIDADFARLQVEGLLPGPGAELIDLGCGAGSNALLFAGLGFRVTGVDVSPTAIAAAAGLAADQNVQIGFKVEDVVQLAGLEDHSFDVATDIGCLHMLVRREDRRSYMRSVRRVLRPGGVWFLLNKVSERDVVIEEEEEYILRRTAWSEKRWMGNDGARVTCGGCGFRSASVRQYQEELRAAGFEVLRSSRLRDYAALLARAP